MEATSVPPTAILPGAEAAAWSVCYLPQAGAPLPDMDAAASTPSEDLARRIAVRSADVACPHAVQENVWIYENFRALIVHLNGLISASARGAVCTPASCRIMSAGDVQYLCASHSEPRECCAMDYMVHTVDGAAALLQSTKAFPSKVLIKAPAAAHFPNLARRLYRCLSHMWVHHHDLFMEYERHTLVALRFTNLCRAYSLVSADQLLIDDTDLEVAAAAARQ